MNPKEKRAVRLLLDALCKCEKDDTECFCAVTHIPNSNVIFVQPTWYGGFEDCFYSLADLVDIVDALDVLDDVGSFGYDKTHYLFHRFWAESDIFESFERVGREDSDVV